MNRLSWLRKAKDAPKDRIDKGVQDASDKINEDFQGSYTDHHISPYQKRFQLDPMHGEELEAFESALDDLSKEYKTHKMKDLIEYGIDDGMFEVDKKGMLRMSQEEAE